MKECKTCKKFKSLTEFGSNKKCKDGRRPICKECRNTLYRERYANDAEFRERGLRATKNWAKGNPNKVREKRKAWEQQNRDKLSHYQRVRKFKKLGLKIEDFEKTLKVQGGVCAICKSDDPKSYWGTFSQDHSHANGKPRGVLCAHCNSGIGMLQDDPSVLESAIKYLTIWKSIHND